MDPSQVTDTFRALPRQGQIEALVRLSHELTILARYTYEVGTVGLTHPARLRAINEVQHRLAAHVLALLRNDSRRYPDDVLVNILLDHEDDPELRRQILHAFSGILSHDAVPR